MYQAFANQARIKANILASYNNVPAPIIKGEEEKELGAEEKKEEGDDKKEGAEEKKEGEE